MLCAVFMVSVYFGYFYIQYSHDTAGINSERLTDVMCIVTGNISHGIQFLEVYDSTFSHGLVLKRQT